MQCSRCGNTAHTEYGSDGLPYCQQCVFYGMNKQCWRCMMYLPAAELQMFKGQLFCQYCIMDLKDEEKASEERFVRREERKPSEDYAQKYIYGERCSRCQRELSVVYIHNGKKLCEICLEQEKAEWKIVGGERPPMTMIRMKEEKTLVSKIVSTLENKISNVIAMLRSGVMKKLAEENKRPIAEKERILDKPLLSRTGPREELETFKTIEDRSEAPSSKNVKDKKKEKTQKRKDGSISLRFKKYSKKN